MKQSRYRVTYETVTPESAEQGMVAEHGWIIPGGWKLGAHDDQTQLTLREALGATGTGLVDCGRWFAQPDGETDYRTGETTTLSLHPPQGITNSSYGRLARLVAGRGGRS